MGGRAATVIALAVLALPLVLAQSASLQAAVDGAQDGVLRLADAAYEGPARVSTRLSIFGVDQRTYLSAAPGTGAILTAASPGVEARFVRFAAGDVGVQVEDGAVGLLGPATFERLGVAIRALPGATVILRNDPSIPLVVDQAAQARFLFSRPGALDARDAGGAAIPGVETTLLAPDGASFASYASEGGFVQLDVPSLERAPDGRTHPVDAGWTIRVRADGYEEQRIPVEEFGQSPMRLTMRSASATPPPVQEPAAGDAPQDAPATQAPGAGAPTSAPSTGAGAVPETTATDPISGDPPLESTAVEASAQTVADAPPMTMEDVALVAGSAAALTAVAGGSVLALRSERRLLKLLALFAPLYTRLRKSALLDSPARAKIRAYVEAHPGVRYRELQRALGFPNGALAHHLQILTREKLVEDVREGQAVRYFVPGARPDAPLDTGERVLAFVRANPGATGVEVAKGLGLSVSLAGYHIQKLDESGCVRREREGVRLKAYATDAPPKPL